MLFLNVLCHVSVSHNQNCEKFVKNSRFEEGYEYIAKGCITLTEGKGNISAEKRR